MPLVRTGRPAALGRTLRWLLATLCAVAVANVYYAQPLLERIGAELGIPTARLGSVVGIGQAGYLVGLVVLVPLGDLVSRRTLISGQLAATAVGTGIAGFATTPTHLMLGVLIAGFFSVVVQVIVAYAAALSDEARRGRDIGFVTSGVVVGVLAARTGSGLVSDLAGWRAVYLGTALASLVLAVLAAGLLPGDRRVVTRRGSTYLTALASVVTLAAANRVFRIRATMTMFLFASFGVLWSGLSLPLSAEPWHLSTTVIGLFGLAGLAGALGAARSGRWADRGHGGTVTVLALLLLIGSWGTIAQAPRSLYLLAVGVVLLDFAVQAVHVTSQGRIIATRPDAASRLIGSYMVFYSLGSALGAVSATSLYAVGGWAAASAAGALYAIVALAIWVIDRVRS
jgi:predicted MFS family arabinose efflux permease